MVMRSPEARAVWMVKLTVTCFSVAPGTRSVAAIPKATSVTWPPRRPDATPTLATSWSDETVTPLTDPATGKGPNLTPTKAKVYVPATAPLPSTAATDQDVPATAAADANAGLPYTAVGATPASKKPAGQFT